jgi:nitrite reductase/ring-hydroxylating ferredoxin subunit
VPDNPKFIGVTDDQGEWTFPDTTEPGWEGGMTVNNPWSWQQGGLVYNAPDAVGRNAPLVVELQFDDLVEYHFIEVDECNLAMAEGQIDEHTIVLTTYDSRRDNTLPAISFNGAPTHVYLTEGEFFQATISAGDVDGDALTLSATPLYNSTFDPATGRFTFQPDSLQVNRYNDHTEGMYVDFKADDGQFASTERMWFYVSDVDGFAFVNEPSDCLGDLDGDGQVTLSDLVILLSNYGMTTGVASDDGDLDDDGDVDLADLAALLPRYGAVCLQ